MHCRCQFQPPPAVHAFSARWALFNFHSPNMTEAEGISLFNKPPAKRRKHPAAAPAWEGTVHDERLAAAEAPVEPAAAGDADVAFRELGLSEWLDKVCSSLGMRQPTEVQRGTIPAVLSGRNVIGVAHTGSGKTAAFALPILQKLAKDPYGVFALVMTPTR
jgi:ATP-dependent helicase YprA (DUF1998 family)